MEHKNLFEEKTSAHFVARIQKLSPDTKAQWGKMNPAQMLLHCQKPFLIADGSLKLKPNPIIKFLFGKKAKKQLLSGVPFKKSLPTFPEAIVKDQRDFEKEKAGLIAAINKFHISGEAGVTKEQHPFFGELTPEHWNVLLTQHLDHHLNQFGV